MIIFNDELMTAPTCDVFYGGNVLMAATTCDDIYDSDMLVGTDGSKRAQC